MPTPYNIAIERSQTIGTRFVSFSAYEPYARHSTMTSTVNGLVSDAVHGGWWGRIGTRELPAALDSLRGAERYERVTAWQEAQYEVAYGLIEAACPEAVGGKRDGGTIYITLPDDWQATCAADLADEMARIDREAVAGPQRIGGF